MTKENAHLYLPLVQAFADGKPLELRLLSGDWVDAGDPIHFSDKPDRYRIKPEPVMVPLGPEDVEPGSVIRSTVNPNGWMTITFIRNEGVGLVRYKEDAHSTFTPYAELLSGGFLIKRPGQDWRPCSKPAP